MSIRSRLAASYCAMSLLVVVVGTVAIIEQVRAAKAASLADARHVAETIGQAIVLMSDELKAEDSSARVQRYTQILSESCNRDLVVVDAGKRILADSFAANIGTRFEHDKGGEVAQTIADGVPRTFVETSDDYPQGIEQLVAPLRSGNAIAGAIVVEYTPFHAEMRTRVGPVIALVASSIIACLIVVASLGIFHVRSIALPLAALRSGVVDLAEGKLESRVEVHGASELADLANCINEMAAERASAETALRETLEMLDQRVQERTCALQRSNEALRNDVAERKLAEEALQRSEGYYRSLFENAHDSILLIDPIAGQVLDANPRACELYGYNRSELVGLGLERICPDKVAYVSHAEETLGRRHCHQFESTHVRKDGTQICLEINASILDYKGREAILSINHDVTERKRLEEQILHSQKMEAVGRLAGGVAHDFNNLLTVITGYGEMVVDGFRMDDPARSLAVEVVRAAQRAARLTRQLLTFSRKQVLVPRLVDIQTVLAELESMLRRLIGEDIEFEVAVDPQAGQVFADPTQLEQVVLNLAVNARDAMPNGGRLKIAARPVELEATDPKTRLEGMRPGPYVLLSVEDDGIGMDDATRSRLFEPFFTTKDPGRGTGLGLATVYAIVQQSSGLIDVRSEAGAGTTFDIYLPRADRAVEEEKPPAISAPRGAETVLVAEDEPVVRNLVKVVLGSLGYKVLDAGDGVEALRMATSYAGTLDLLLTDVVMPRMNGHELADKIAAIHPNTRVLYMSGYTDDESFRHRVLEAGVAILHKPFSPASLGSRVREALDQDIGLKA